MVGRVTFWNGKKGYGFIRANETDYYVRFRDLSDDFITSSGKKQMCYGETVNFIPKMGARGPYATEVVVKI